MPKVENSRGKESVWCLKDVFDGLETQTGSAKSKCMKATSVSVQEAERGFRSECELLGSVMQCVGGGEEEASSAPL